MTIGKLRSILYTLAKLLGDLSAIRRGKIGERIARRTAGQLRGRLLGKIFR